MSDRQSRREELESMRGRLSRAFYDSETKPADLSALSRRIQEVDREIEVLDAAEAEDDIGRAIEAEDEAFDPETI